MKHTITIYVATALFLSPAWAGPTLNGWDTSKVYVIRTAIYSYGSPELPPRSIQVLDESNLNPPKPLTRFGNILTNDDHKPKSFTFSNSPAAGNNSPQGPRMFLAQGYPEGGAKTDIEILEYNAIAALVRKSYLGATFGIGSGQLVSNSQPNNRVKIGSIRYNPMKNTMAVSATLTTDNGATVKCKAFEFELPDWPANGGTPVMPVVPVQVYEAPAGHTVYNGQPVNIDFDDNGNMYMTGRSLNVNAAGTTATSDVIKVNTIGLTGGLTPYVIPITGAYTDNLLIEGSVENQALPDHVYGGAYSLAVRTVNNSLMLVFRTQEVIPEPTIEYSLTGRAANGNLLFIRNWAHVDPHLGINSNGCAAQRDYESGAVFVSCDRGDPGGGPKSLNANYTTEVIGWRNWDVCSPPMAVLELQPDDDGDGDVDQEDFGKFQLCYSGDGILYQFGCETLDFDHDMDIDQTDFSEFYKCMAGANITPPPGC